MATLSQLQADCYRRLGFASSPATEVTTRLTAFLNETQQEILAVPGLAVLLERPSITFASVASTAEYTLGTGIEEITAISERTNDTLLTPQSLGWYRQAYPDPSAFTATPDSWVDLGWAAVSAQPSDASQLLADSTAAGDTNTVFLEGFRSSGEYVSLSATMTGATAKSLSTTITDIVRVTKFYLSAAAVGTVTLVEDAEGGTVLATISIGQTFARYKRIALAPTPATAITYTCDVDRRTPDLANANDQPMLPVRFHQMLVTGTRMKEYEKREDGRYEFAKAEWDRQMKALRFWIANTAAAGTPNLRGRLTRRPSQLGAYFPAGS